MILIDMSQVMLSSLFAQSPDGKNINESLIRHIALNCLRSYKQKFGATYGRPVICVDSRSYWRKGIFPYYKANRKKDRKKSGMDWKLILDTIASIREEIKVAFPYQVIEVEEAEADDIIGVLARRYHVHEKILILSGDKDFGQLQKFPNVYQFAPVKGSWIKVDDPRLFLKEHILRGDTGDGVPNFLSADDVLAKDGLRQTPLSEKKLELWLQMEPERFCTTQMMRGYRRNEALVDLDKIPDTLVQAIIEAYDQPYNTDRSKIFPYLIQHRMKNLTECVSEF